MRLGPTRIRVDGESSVWDSSDIRFITGGVTIDPNTVPKRSRITGSPDSNGFRIIYAGDILGKITATGLYGPYDKNATDGRAIARYLAAGTYNLDSGYNDSTFPPNPNGVSIGAVDRARILRARMSIQYTDADLSAIKTQLLNNGTLVTFVEETGTPGYPVQGVALLPATLSLAVGQTYDIMPVWTPMNAANKHGDFATSNAAYATVTTENGISGAIGHITAIAAGTANITFTSSDGGFTASVAVTVA
jgi:uncharacterized protein YjdB